MAYILLLAAISADYAATEETLAAGIAGYKERAEALRPKAIALADRRGKDLLDALAIAKKAKVSTALVGRPSRTSGNKWEFGTASEKSQAIAGISNSLAEWKAYTTALRQKKIYPQVALNFWKAMPGSCGSLVGISDDTERRERTFISLTTLRLVSDDSCIIEIPLHRLRDDGDAPSIERIGRGFGINGLIVHRGTKSGEHFPGVYQFVGIQDGKPIFLKTDIPIGEGLLDLDDFGHDLLDLKRSLQNIDGR